MSRSQNLLTGAVVVGLGVISGGYIFRPAIEDLEKEKRGEPLEKSATQQSALPRESKVGTPEKSSFNDVKVSVEKTATEKVEHSLSLTDPEAESKDDSKSKNISRSRSNQGLPPYLQPWDARER